jgi:phage terminase large subunit
MKMKIGFRGVVPEAKIKSLNREFGVKWSYFTEASKCSS